MSRDRSQAEYPADEPSEETAYERRDEDRMLPGFIPYGWPAVFGRGDEYEYAEDDYAEHPYEEEYSAEYERADEEGTWLDEGLITLTIVAGVVLFLFPEPATSGLGILLIAIGVVAWLIDWAT